MHLESRARQGDFDAEAQLAAGPRLPGAGAYLWAWWNELHETRGVNGMALARLTRAEIRLWEQDELVRLERWERRLLLRIDAAFVRIMGGADDDQAEEEG